MSLEPVGKSNAVNITTAIEQACQTHLEFAGDVFKSKRVGFSSDGAAVMQRRGHWTAPEEAALVAVNCRIVSGCCDCFIPFCQNISCCVSSVMTTASSERCPVACSHTKQVISLYDCWRPWKSSTSDSSTALSMQSTPT